MPGSGTCLCGKSSFEFEGEPAAQLACNCLPCRKMSGTPTSHNLIIPQDKFKSSGTLKKFERKADSGNMVTYYYCHDCPTINHALLEGMPGVVLLKLGTVDSTDVFDNYYPSSELYVKNRPEWAQKFEKASQVQESS